MSAGSPAPFSSGNLFAGIPEHLPTELVEILSESRGVRVERIVSQGHASPEGFWYDQPDDEFVVLISGRACLRFEGEEEPRMLGPGDYLLIPSRARHRVEWTGPEDAVWLAVHF